MKKSLREYASCSYDSGGPSHEIKITRSVETHKDVAQIPEDWYEGCRTGKYVASRNANPGNPATKLPTRTEYQYRWHLSIGTWQGAYETQLTPITVRYLIDALSRTLEDMEGPRDKPVFGRQYDENDSRCSVYRKAGEPSGPKDSDSIRHLPVKGKVQITRCLEVAPPKGCTEVILVKGRPAKEQRMLDEQVNGDPDYTVIRIDIE